MIIRNHQNWPDDASESDHPPHAVTDQEKRNWGVLLLLNNHRHHWYPHDCHHHHSSRHDRHRRRHRRHHRHRCHHCPNHLCYWQLIIQRSYGILSVKYPILSRMIFSDIEFVRSLVCKARMGVYRLTLFALYDWNYSNYDKYDTYGTYGTYDKYDKYVWHTRMVHWYIWYVERCINQWRVNLPPNDHGWAGEGWSDWKRERFA